MKFKEYVNNNILFALQQAKSGRSILLTVKSTPQSENYFLEGKTNFS